MDKLFIACVTFFTIDLIFVGLTCLHVVKYLREIDKRLRFIGTGLSMIIPHKDNRDFIIKGE